MIELVITSITLQRQSVTRWRCSSTQSTEGPSSGDEGSAGPGGELLQQQEFG